MTISLNPTLSVKSKITFEVSNGCISLFKAPEVLNTDGVDFTQDFGNTFTVQNATVDLQILMEGITNANQIYFLSDKGIQLKLVPQGSLPSTTPPLTLFPGLPSLLSVQYLIGIYVTNQTGSPAQLMVHGVGINA